VNPPPTIVVVDDSPDVRTLVRELPRAHGGDADYRPSDDAFVASLPRSGP
jgi:hypothetical protein